MPRLAGVPIPYKPLPPNASCRRATLNHVTRELTKRHIHMTDNTNADIETRAHWVRVAKEFNVPIRCVRFTASTHLAEHNDAVRALNPDTVCTPASLPHPIVASAI